MTTFRGVYGDLSLQENKYIAFININDKALFLSSMFKIGKFATEVDAAKAHDVVAIKLYGSSARLNFPLNNYAKVLVLLPYMTIQQVIDSVRSHELAHLYAFQSSPNISHYYGVVRHIPSGKWQSSYGLNYLGSFDTEEEAAIAHDIASIKQKKYEALTNLDIKDYDVEKISQPNYNPFNFPAHLALGDNQTGSLSNPFEVSTELALGNNQTRTSPHPHEVSTELTLGIGPLQKGKEKALSSNLHGSSYRDLGLALYTANQGSSKGAAIQIKVPHINNNAGPSTDVANSMPLYRANFGRKK